MKVKVLEVFKSIQGEGIYTGIPSIFVRFGGCNLRCVFGNSRCDTPYSSFDVEEAAFNTLEEVISEINIDSNSNINHLVITGGEPLLHREAVEELIRRYPHYTITIETNGTLPPIKGYKNVLWSISPKLSTSVDKELKYLTKEQAERHDKTRINKEVLKEFNDENYQLKFVYSSQESVAEIKEIVQLFDEPTVLLMPEGTTNNQLNEIQKECAYVCILNGWRFCDRLHIRIWGDKRGV